VSGDSVINFGRYKKEVTFVLVAVLVAIFVWDFVLMRRPL
jgi:hypothetical protein